MWRIISELKNSLVSDKILSIPVAAGTVSKVMMMQQLPVLRDSVHTSMYYAKRLLTPSCPLSLSLSLSSCTRYVLVQYSMYYTSTYQNSPGTPPIAFVYKGGVA